MRMDEGQGSLTFYKPQAEDKGSYQCIVSGTGSILVVSFFAVPFRFEFALIGSTLSCVFNLPPGVVVSIILIQSPLFFSMAISGRVLCKPIFSSALTVLSRN